MCYNHVSFGNYFEPWFKRFLNESFAIILIRKLRFKQRDFYAKIVPFSSRSLSIKSVVREKSYDWRQSRVFWRPKITLGMASTSFSCKILFDLCRLSALDYFDGKIDAPCAILYRVWGNILLGKIPFYSRFFTSIWNMCLHFLKKFILIRKMVKCSTAYEKYVSYLSENFIFVGSLYFEIFQCAAAGSEADIQLFRA